MNRNAFGRGIDRFGVLAGIALALAFAASHLTGCDLPQPLTPSQADSAQAAIDSARHASDSVRPVRYHRIQVCAAGKPYVPSCDNCDTVPFSWGGTALVGRDTVELGVDSIGLSVDTCQDLGRLADTAHFKLKEIGGSGAPPDSAWFLVDSSAQKLWMPWRRVVLHPDSLRAVSDSLAPFRRHGLGVTP